MHKINGHWWVGIPISMRQITSSLFNHSVQLSRRLSDKCSGTGGMSATPDAGPTSVHS